VLADILARVTASHTSLNISIKRDGLLAMLTDKFVSNLRTRAKTTSSHSRRLFLPFPGADPANSFSKIKMAKQPTPLS